MMELDGPAMLVVVPMRGPSAMVAVGIALRASETSSARASGTKAHTRTVTTATRYMLVVEMVRATWEPALDL